MIAWLAAAAALTLQAAEPADSAWTWTLYEGDGPLVLANEVPDTRHLRTTLECDPGTGVARLSVYGAALNGMATVKAGPASATTEATRVRDATRLALRVDHPVFVAFAAGGELNVAVGDQQRALTIPRAHLTKLRRFAELCGG